MTLTQLSQRVTALEQVIIQLSVNQTTKQLEQLAQSAIEADKRLTRLENLAERAENRLDRLEKAVADNTEAITGLQNAVEKLDQKVDNGFKQLTQQISNLGSRWGLHNESLWRQTIATLLEKSYGVTVQKLQLAGEEFDVLIRNGDHILIELTARFHQQDITKVTRKRQLYTNKVQAPSRFIIAAASIHSQTAQKLIALGFELIEPDEDL